ncbi:MAG: phosphoribosylformylglycinamidine synthase, partial [Phycisphaerae bacterium]|nr:phosphoribosylformylglycinamidine synthase [Phycisphaerae bacterium]
TGHEPQPDGSTVIRNLLRSTVAAATHELIAGRRPNGSAAPPIDWCLSVFVDNAGVIAFDDANAVCFKVETHNHPSAIEPYGGAATGIGGCIRDVMGTGLGAKPIAATDVFCVAPLSAGTPGGPSIPAGCLPPARILEQVVAGVRDYGNRMGIPTLNGAVWFDERHVGNPLVFCGTVGVLPRDRIRGAARAGDAIVAIGGRTGRDGIHGATFSSAELTDSHADEFGHAVQIGNAITEKKCLDALLAARDFAGGPLYNAVTDCGAGGFSSAVGEMGGELGAEVHLDRAPLKYDGLSPTEVWISEAQERMVLAVPADQLVDFRAVCEKHEVELAELGRFGTPDRSLRLFWHGTEVGRLDMRFLHEGIPTPTREALWDPAWGAAQGGVRCGHGGGAATGADAIASRIDAALRALMAHPNIASREWIIRQYDHEVQGGSVIKPLVGARSDGPGDAAVIMPVPDSTRGLAIGNGLATGLCADPYLMGLAAIDECVRNLVCVGANPDRIAILDNFCWPSCKDERNLGSLVRAAEACYDGAHAYRTPFISGKDSLNNQFVAADGRVIQIPPTLLISGFGIVDDVEHCVTMDLKHAGNLLVLVGETSG